MSVELWEILVPVEFNCPTYEERGFTPTKEGSLERWHGMFDSFVRDLVGGFTIMKPTKKGSWTSQHAHTYDEQMIPVRIACTKEQIETIAAFAKTHYSQETVMYYKLSDEVYFV